MIFGTVKNIASVFYRTKNQVHVLWVGIFGKNRWGTYKKHFQKFWSKKFVVKIFYVPISNLEWMEYVAKEFKPLYADLKKEEIESIFLLAYINTWGFHIPGFL